ncbi:LysR substrate-binding domain-containing protein [Paracoccus onubensis]|uniref:LysR family transcriptional regulator n=1 Tax=Paracoccus onubensis TaxID=1675788 RepID=UPI002731B7DA|nr:LysR family transcriptional regulator [Paracoccus onubensis]MDP0927130.1 LysR substrate-binding domain-containing protein [Paracoccus onubensis]
MNLEDITVFLQIAAAGSLTGAARVLYRPKATVSHQLRRLEEEIGAPLFIRSANRLVLSDAGTEFLEHARAIRRACERGLDSTRAGQKNAQGTMRIGSTGEFASNLIAPLILHFARHNPDLRLDLTVVRSDLLLSSRESYDCLLYLGEPSMPQVADMTGRLLGRFSFGLYCSPGYLARHPAPREPAELRQHDLLAYHNAENITLWELRNGDEEYSLPPHTKLLSNDYWVIKLSAIHNHGICFVPKFFARLEVEQGLLVPVLPNWSSREVPLYALFASHRLRNTQIADLINSLTQNFADMQTYLYTASAKKEFFR